MSQPQATMPSRDRATPTKVAGLSMLERPGPGPAVLLLHGIGSNARSFAPLFPALPAELRLIAWNAPGYLGSEPLAADWPVAADYARAAERLLDGLGLARVHVVGHSLGTLIAAALAEHAPQRVASLTLAAAANGYGCDRGAALPPGVAARLEDLERLGAAAFSRARAPRLVFDPAANRAVVAQVEAEMAQIDPGGYGQALRMLASGDLPSTVARLGHRPNFIIGAEDRITPPDQTKAAAAAWPAARGGRPEVAVIPRAGHAVHQQAPVPFARALLRLVPALRGTQPLPGKGDPHDG